MGKTVYEGHTHLCTYVRMYIYWMYCNARITVFATCGLNTWSSTSHQLGTTACENVLLRFRYYKAIGDWNNNQEWHNSATIMKTGCPRVKGFCKTLASHGWGTKQLALLYLKSKAATTTTSVNFFQIVSCWLCRMYDATSCKIVKLFSKIEMVRHWIIRWLGRPAQIRTITKSLVKIRS